jgi:histidine ammonia-lyase
MNEIRSAIRAQWLDEPGCSAVYGFNTGCGVLKDRRLNRDETLDFNRKYILSHCTGVGSFLPLDVIRAAVLHRINSFAKGYSGVRPQVALALLELLNRGVTPAVPSIGSLGGSGDLAQLSHIGAVLIGEPNAQAWFEEQLLSAPEALHRAGLQPITLEAKEGMALNNGVSVSLAWSSLLLSDIEELLDTAEACGALSLEAIRGETAAFDARIHESRGYAGQQETAALLRSLLSGSQRATEEARAIWLGEPGSVPHHTLRVQDAYSFRCIPQEHGAARDALAFFRYTVQADLNGVSDNPLVFLEPGGRVRALSGGNFLGQQIAAAADFIALALTKVAHLSERRTFRLLNPSLSFQLPDQLTGGKAGVNSGLMIAQYTQAALVNECALLASPASILPAMTSGGQEDSCSMALTAARKLHDMVQRAQSVLAIELICAAQGITTTQSILGDPTLGKGTQQVLQAVRSVVAELGEDRYLASDIGTATVLVRSGACGSIVRQTTSCDVSAGVASNGDQQDTRGNLPAGYISTILQRK